MVTYITEEQNFWPNKSNAKKVKKIKVDKEV